VRVKHIPGTEFPSDTTACYSSYCAGPILRLFYGAGSFDPP
jgi:hypothetical protein